MKRSIVVIACLAVAAAPRVSADPKRDGEVRAVSVAPASGRVDVVIGLQGAVEVQDFTLDAPARLVVDLIRGHKAGDALTILRSTNKRIAPTVEKVLRSAIANAENQRIMTGPNNRPTAPVPLRCIANRMNSTMRVSGMTKGCSAGVATSRPSTADSTEMAGVIMPSP